MDVNVDIYRYIANIDLSTPSLASHLDNMPDIRVHLLSWAVAQLVARSSVKAKVVGSNPALNKSEASLVQCSLHLTLKVWDIFEAQ